MPTETSTLPAAEIAIVEAFFEAFRARDTDRALALMADDVVYQNVPLPPHVGKATVLRTLKAFERVVTEFQVKMRNIAERDGVVLTERVDILSGPLLYLDIWVCGTFEVKGGKIILWRDYFDLAEVLGALFVGPVRKVIRALRPHPG